MQALTPFNPSNADLTNLPDGWRPVYECELLEAGATQVDGYRNSHPEVRPWASGGLKPVMLHSKLTRKWNDVGSSHWGCLTDHTYLIPSSTPIFNAPKPQVATRWPSWDKACR